MLILRRKSIVTVGVFYYMPDFPNIVNEFVWQVEDVVPEIPRIHAFLCYWKKEKLARVQQVLVSHGHNQGINMTEFYRTI